MAYNMKNSALKMSAKSGSPMQKNFAGSPVKQTTDPIPTQQDSINAYNIEHMDYDSKDFSQEDYKNARTLISNTKTNIKKAKSSGGRGEVQRGDVKNVLGSGDYKSVASSKTIEELDLPETKGGSLRTRIKKKRMLNADEMNN